MSVISPMSYFLQKQTFRHITKEQLEEIRPTDVYQAFKKAKQAGMDFAEHPQFGEIIHHLLDEFEKRKEAYERSTIDRLNSAWRNFVSWCIQNNIQSLPASAKTLEDFLKARETQLHRDTLSVYLWAISKMHRITGCIDPTKDELVMGTYKRIRKTKVRQGEEIRQATPFLESNLDHAIEVYRQDDSLKSKRDLAMLAVSYEGILRADELVRIKHKHIEFMPDGSAVLHILFSKQNKSGKPDTNALSPCVTQLLKEYIEAGGLDERDEEDYLFIGISKHDSPFKPKRCSLGEPVYKPMTTRTTRNIFKKAWENLGLADFSHERPFTGHSPRVGAAQDLLRQGFSTAQIQQSGRWKTANMVTQYGRAILAEQGAMAQSRKYKKLN